MNALAGLVPGAEAAPVIPQGSTSADLRLGSSAQSPAAHLAAVFAAVLAEAISPQVATNVERQLPAGGIVPQPGAKSARRDAKALSSAQGPAVASGVEAPSAGSPPAVTMTAATEALRALVEDVAGESASPRQDAVPEHKEDEKAVTVPVVASGTKVAPDVAALTDPSVVVRDLNSLQPQFRAKVERVIARMKEEFGHDVTVMETWRSQARQDVLHEMGRTQPGAIVTWTRHSRHAEGRAADLMVDGRWDNTGGYRTLMRVAREEGLQTVGWQDPGHVEMATDPGMARTTGAVTIDEIGVSAPQATLATAQGVADPLRAFQEPGLAGGLDSVRGGAERATTVAQNMLSSQATRVAPVAPVRPGTPTPNTPIAQATQPGQTSPVAPVAQVASVAQLAQVAQVASPARVAQVAAGPSSASQGPNASATAPSEHATEGGHEDRRRDDGDRPPENPSAIARANAHASLDSMRETSRDPSPSTQRDVAPMRASAQVAPLRVPASPDLAPVHALDAAGRAARVLDLQDARSAQPVSHMLLRLDDADGGQDRIRVDLRGSSVGATIDVRNPDVADAISNRMHELTTALASRGLEAESLRVRATASGGSTLHPDLARVVAAGGDAQALRLGTLFADDGPASSPSRDSQGQRPQQDSSRHRSRREQKEGTS